MPYREESRYLKAAKSQLRPKAIARADFPVTVHQGGSQDFSKVGGHTVSVLKKFRLSLFQNPGN